jgi:hypothetical protein
LGCQRHLLAPLDLLQQGKAKEVQIISSCYFRELFRSVKQHPSL